MSGAARRTALIVIGLALAGILAAGCTLAGADAAPLTPSLTDGDAAGQSEAENIFIPTPTAVVTDDVFSTQTAAAPVEGQSAEETVDTPTDEGAEQPEGEAATEEAPAEEVAEEPAEEPAVVEECPAVYVVQSGDTMYNIATTYGLTVDELASANGIADPEQISIGDELSIPGCGSNPPADSGDSAASGGEEVYIVQSGDTLFQIALSYGVDFEDLVAYNGIEDPDSLEVGQEILIPTN